MRKIISKYNPCNCLNSKLIFPEIKVLSGLLLISRRKGRSLDGSLVYRSKTFGGSQVHYTTSLFFTFLHEDGRRPLLSPTGGSDNTEVGRTPVKGPRTSIFPPVTTTSLGPHDRGNDLQKIYHGGQKSNSLQKGPTRNGFDKGDNPFGRRKCLGVTKTRG